MLDNACYIVQIAFNYKPIHGYHIEMHTYGRYGIFTDALDADRFGKDLTARLESENNGRYYSYTVTILHLVDRIYPVVKPSTVDEFLNSTDYGPAIDQIISGKW